MPQTEIIILYILNYVDVGLGGVGARLWIMQHVGVSGATVMNNAAPKRGRSYCYEQCTVYTWVELQS